MSLLAILTGLYRLNPLLPSSKPRCVATTPQHLRAHRCCSILFLEFNPWLKWCLLTNRCWSAEKTQFFSFSWTLSPNYFSHPPSLISKGHASPFTALTWNNHLYTMLAGEVCAYHYLFCLSFHSSLPVKTVPLISTFTSLFWKGLSILLLLTPQAGIFIMFASTCDFSGMTSPCYFCFVN